MHLQPDHVAEPALPYGFFHGLQQIVAFHFLDRHFGVARDVEGMGVENLEPGKRYFKLAMISCSSHTKT